MIPTWMYLYFFINKNAIDLLEQDQRNEEDVKVIMKGTRHLKFFQELLQSKNKHRLHYLTCKYMTIKSYC